MAIAGFIFNVPAVFSKNFFKAHCKVANGDSEPSQIANTMAETPPRAGIVGAADADMVGEFEELLLRLNKDDELACCWIRARAAALVAQAKATADPESFDLAEGTKEARDRFAMLKDLSKTKEFRKDKRFAALSDWKLAGLLVIDDENQPAPGLVLPSMVEEEESFDVDDEEEGEDEEEDEEDEVEFEED